MNYSHMSAGLGMYNGYMPPPPYGGSQNYVPNQYSQQLVTHQQPMVQHQQHQQPLMQNQLLQHQYNIDSYNNPQGPLLSKQSTVHTPSQTHDPGYSSQPQAHQIQGPIPPLQWMNKLPPMPPLSPINNSAAQHLQPSPQQNMQQSVVISQRCTSNPSPIQQHPPYPPPLSPMHRLTPQNSQMSPGPQQFSQIAPASDARAMNHVRRLSASSDFAAHQSLSTSSPSQCHTVHCASGKMSSQTHGLSAPLAPQSHQAVFNHQQHVSASQADPPALLQPCSRPSPYSTTGLIVSNTVRQSSSSQAQLSYSNVYQSAQTFSNTNQINQVGDRLDPRQGNGEIFARSKAPERQKERCPDNMLSVAPSPSSTRLPPNNDLPGAKTGAFSNSNSNIGSRNSLPIHPFSVPVDSSNRLSSAEQGYSLFQRPALVSHFSAPEAASQSWGGFQPNGPPAPQVKTSVGRGTRRNRGAAANNSRGAASSSNREVPASSSRARGRGASRGRGRARGRGAAPPQSAPVPLQPLQWCMPPTSSMHSFQSDIEAMQASVVADMVTSIHSRHPEESSKAPQSNRAQSSSNLNSCNTSSTGETLHSSNSTSQTSAPTNKASSAPVKSSSRAAALEAIKVKQEAVENMVKTRRVQSDQKNTKETPITNNALVSSCKKTSEIASPRQPSSRSAESGSQQVSCSSNESLQPQVTQSFQSPNLLRKGEQNPESLSRSVSMDTARQDSLAFLLDMSTSVEKKSQNAVLTKMKSASNQAEKRPQTGHQESMPSSKPMNVNSGKMGSLQRSVSSGSKLNHKAHSQSAGRHSVRQNAPTAVAAPAKHQNKPSENKRPMTAKERVISMWRDGQVVGRNPTLLKRSAKTNETPHPPQQSGEHPSKSQNKPFSSDTDILEQNGKDADAPSIKKSKQAPKEELKTLSSKPKLDLNYIMFHGHKLICLKSAREKMLLLCQFQFECFPDKGIGSVNNCIDRSLRVKKKPLQHQSQADVVSYLKKNDYKIDSEVLTINLEDARRVYHHMYNIRNCVSVSCVVEVSDQPVDLAHVIPGSRKRTFQREILGSIKTETDSTDDSCYGNQQNSKSQSASQDENGVNTGPNKTGNAGDEDARSDNTLTYGADKAADDDDVMIVSVDESPNLIRYDGEGQKVGMLCNSHWGSVRAYVHSNAHYLVIDDLCKIFGYPYFNAFLDNQNITVYSCCPEIGAFLNQISDKFPAVSSLHECLVKEKDFGVQWDQSTSENSTVSSNRPCLKQEIVDEQSSLRALKKSKLSAATAGSSKQCNSSESDLDSERQLQIDMGESPNASKGNVLARASTSIMSVNQLNSSKQKAADNSTLISEQASTDPPVSSSPESHSSTETLVSTLVLEVAASNSNEDASRAEHALKSSSSHKDVLKQQDKRNNLQVNASHSACDTFQKDSENNTECTRCSRRSASSSSVISLPASQQGRLLTISDSFQHTLKEVSKVKLTEDDIDIFTSENSDPMGPSSLDGNKTKSYLIKVNSQLCQRNSALIGIVHKLRKDLAAAKAAKDKAEKVSKHLEDALATMTSSFPFGNSSAPIVIDEDEMRP